MPLTFQVCVPTTERLDRFLADQLAMSRTRSSRLVALGAVEVNASPARAARTLARGDTVSIVWPEPEVKVAGPVRTIDLDVRFEDEHLLVVNKPAGLVVHPAPGHRDDTLVQALAARGTPGAGGTADRPGIVHRLDRDTSGLMVVAKTARAHQRLAADLAARRVGREYAALVWGHPADRTIDMPIARHPHDRRRMAAVATGRAARTRVRQVARFELVDLVHVILDTGRTHQIRVHMEFVGHPVVGDAVYGGGGARRAAPNRQAAARALEGATPRQALHAARLRFRHPEHQETLEFTADWPDDLRRCMTLASGDPGLLDRPSVLDYLGLFRRDG